MQTATTKDTLAEIETVIGIETGTNAETGLETEPETETTPDSGLDLALPADNHQHLSSDRSDLSPHRTTHSKATMTMEAPDHQS